MKKILLCVVFCCVQPIYSQANISVSLDDAVYYVLEMAELRGLCAPLPRVKPYTRKLILKAIAEIEAANTDDGTGTVVHARRLSETELGVLRNAKERLSQHESGLNLARLVYGLQSLTPGGLPVKAALDLGLEMRLSGGWYDDAAGGGGGFYPGMDVWPSITAAGDIHDNFSVGFAIIGGVLYANRDSLGQYNIRYLGYTDENGNSPTVETFAYQHAFFPGEYIPKWDGLVWNIGHISNSYQLAWPEDISLGYAARSEIAGTLLNDDFLWRIGSIEREYGGVAHGYSLDLNKTAQPFLGFDMMFSPWDFLTISSVTGILEFYSMYGQTESSKTFQPAFSLSQIEVRYKNYASFGFGSSVVWPKRFELAYMIPLIDKLLYQMNIGDFDNTGEFANLKLQLPGVGNVWGALFLDEINPEKEIFELDRALYAFQAGAQVAIPGLSFGSITLSYTKIEPYCYTHPKTEVPWYSDPVEEAFLNHGEPLGYNLKPNSDELKLVFRFMPRVNTALRFNYQMIRHGADYGSGQVDGSSYFSELLGSGRSTTPELRKYFLKDGAYEWTHVIRAGCDYAIPQAAIALYVDAGVVISRWTNIDGAPNTGKPAAFSAINTPEYPSSTGFVLTFGARWFY
jgi:hypothetical protein